MMCPHKRVEECQRRICVSKRCQALEGVGLKKGKEVQGRGVQPAVVFGFQQHCRGVQLEGLPLTPQPWCSEGFKGGVVCACTASDASVLWLLW